MSTMTGAGVPAPDVVGDEAAGAALAAEESAGAADAAGAADEAAAGAPLFGVVWAPAISDYAANGMAKVRTIVTRRRMGDSPSNETTDRSATKTPRAAQWCARASAAQTWAG